MAITVVIALGAMAVLLATVRQVTRGQHMLIVSKGGSGGARQVQASQEAHLTCGGFHFIPTYAHKPETKVSGTELGE